LNERRGRGLWSIGQLLSWFAGVLRSGTGSKGTYRNRSNKEKLEIHAEFEGKSCRHEVSTMPLVRLCAGSNHQP
jgi:hypothetical protein